MPNIFAQLGASPLMARIQSIQRKLGVSQSVAAMIAAQSQSRQRPQAPQPQQQQQPIVPPRGKNNLQQGQGLQQILKQAIAGVGNPTTTGMGQFVGAASNLAAKISPVASGVLKFGSALFDSIEKVNRWSNSLKESNAQFAKVSPAMALVETRQKLRDFQLDFIRGQRRAATAETVNQATHRSNVVSAEMQDRIYNNLGPLYSKFLSGWDEVKRGFMALGDLSATKIVQAEKELGILPKAKAYGITPTGQKAMQDLQHYGMPERFRDVGYSSNGGDF